MIKEKVGKNLKESRTQNKLTQKEISAKLKVNQSLYQKYEYGKIEMDYEKIVAVCQILEITPNYLFGFEEV